MAWRIAPHIVRGELDNRTKGFVTGKIWLHGQPDPMLLNLCGHPEPDLAGRRLEFTNPTPDDSTEVTGFLPVQKGVLGEFTAARKVKVPSLPLDQLLRSNGNFPYHWSDCLYLEWFSEGNGRVVIESTDFKWTVSEPVWTLTPADSVAQRRLSATAWDSFMHSLAGCLNAVAQAKSTESPDAPESLTPDLADEEAIDQLLRINELKHEAHLLSGGQMQQGSFGPLPLAVEEEFWRHVVDFEKAPQRKRKDLLAEDGVVLPPLLDLSDQELTDTLWIIIRRLAARDIYLLCTDHLSDRELYQQLVESILEEETTVLEPGSGWRNHISVDEYGTAAEDGTSIYLRYYAGEVERKRWASDFPDDPMPAHEQPPYDRDRHLPKAD